MISNPDAFQGGRSFQLHRLLEEANAEAPALFIGDDVVSYGELVDSSRRVAAGLGSLGVGPQDRVVFFGENCREQLDVVFACAQLNAVCTPMNWRLSPAEITHVLSDSGARVAFVTSAQLDVLDSIRSDMGSLQSVVRVDADFDTWRASFAPDPVRAHREPSDVAILLYTSGTTAHPKGVMLTHANFAATFPDTAALWRLDGASVMLSVLPWFHIAGIGGVIGTMWTGSPTVIHNDATPGAILAAIPRHRVTNLVLVSLLVQRMLEHPARASTDLSSLRLISYGASPISESVLRDAMAGFGCPMLQIYGLTETVGTVTVLQPEDHALDEAGLARLRSCGRPIDGVDVRLVDPDTGADVVDAAGIGEIWTRSPRVMRGYWNNATATAGAITSDGWFRTGDLAYRDADGFLFLCDRLKDMIVSGGENIYASEVENVLQGHPSIAEVAVIGVPDELWGESPKAMVVVRPGEDLRADDLIAFARERLAKYKCPASVDFTDALPRNASGKVLKKTLREPFWAGRTRRIS